MNDTLQTILTGQDTATKQFRILSYLTLSSLVAFLFSNYVLSNPMLTALLAPTINYALYLIAEALKKEGYEKDD